MALRIRYWGARGSIPTPAREMAAYGGNTACVELTLSDGREVILDGGTGIRELGRARSHASGPVDLLLTHLHLDHIQGLMFFAPLFDPRSEICIWGPPALDGSLLTRLGRYISAPLAPVEIRELPARVSFEEVKTSTWRLGPALIEAAFVNHRGPTLGYRITDGDATVAYIPDHEPALGQRLASASFDWVSGASLARDADLLIHDSQYTDGEYRNHIGWGHSGLSDAMTFAERVGARRLVLFHHEPLHDDAALDSLGEEAAALDGGRFEQVSLAREQETIELPT
jgi:phosphoribosyl 1,2-cyclic phosphodiesterase